MRDGFTELDEVRRGDNFVLVNVVHLEDEVDSLFHKTAE